MKVNRSKLFKNAWKCVRKWHVSLSKALKMAWAMAKKEAQIRAYYNIEECYYFNFNLWDAGKIRRAYYNTNGMSKYWNKSRNNFVELGNI